MSRDSEMDTPQQAHVLRVSPTARKVRSLFPAGTEVAAWNGDHIGTSRGTVERHIPMGNGQGGVIRVKWGNGQIGRHSAINLVRVDSLPEADREVKK